MNKKIFALFLSIIMMFMCIPVTSFAADSNTHTETIYQHILNDYLEITKIEKTEADSIYEKITAAAFPDSKIQQMSN